MNIYKNKKNLLVLMGLFSFSMQQSIDASQYSKKAGMSLIAAAKILATDRSAMQTVYPENDSHNHNIMNGTYFDTRPFVNRAEKRNFIEHHFKAMNVVTDMNELCVDMLMYDYHSRQQLVNFMYLAQQAASKDTSDAVELKHLEKAFIKINDGASNDCLSNDVYEYDVVQIAYHEAGHAVMAVVQDIGFDIEWASIKPSSNRTLGYVQIIANTYSRTDGQRLNYIIMSLAGGVTEQFFGLPEKFGFETYEKTLDDFWLRGTGKDFSNAATQVEILASSESEKNRNNCLLSEHKFIGLDDDDFIATYDQCTKKHLDEAAVRDKRIDIMRDQFLATLESVRKYHKEIQAVAQELLREKVVSGKRIKEIIHEVQLNNNK